MAQIQETHINAYRADAEAKQTALQVAQGEFDTAVAAYVAKGGKATDVDPNAKPEKKAKADKEVSQEETPQDEAPTQTLSDSFTTDDGEYNVVRTKEGKVSRYQLDGKQIRKADYESAYEASLKPSEEDTDNDTTN